MKSREASGSLYDNKTSIRLKSKFHKTVVRSINDVWVSVLDDRYQNWTQNEFYRDDNVKMNEWSDQRERTELDMITLRKYIEIDPI